MSEIYYRPVESITHIGAVHVSSSLSRIQQWLVDGIYHRLDGPAAVWADGRNEWYINGKDITFGVNKWLKENNIAWPFNDDQLVEFKLRFM